MTSRAERGKRVDRWSYDHPWLWAVVPMLLGAALGIRVVHSPVVAVALAVLSYGLVGWSVARGWGRRRISRKYGWDR